MMFLSIMRKEFWDAIESLDFEKIFISFETSAFSDKKWTLIVIAKFLKFSIICEKYITIFQTFVAELSNIADSLDKTEIEYLLHITIDIITNSDILLQIISDDSDLSSLLYDYNNLEYVADFIDFLNDVNDTEI